MSTKCSLAYGRKFHLFTECFDSGKNVWLELDNGSAEASGHGGVRIEIPIAVWEVIRQHTPARFDLAPLSDSQLRAEAEKRVDSLRAEYREVCSHQRSAGKTADGKQNPWTGRLYAAARLPRNKHLATVLGALRKDRAAQRKLRREIIAARSATAHTQSDQFTAPTATITSPAAPINFNAQLRNPATGRLDANRIADLLGISISDIARLCGVSTHGLSRAPSNSGIQAKLQPLEDVAQALIWCGDSETKLRAWLNRPNHDFPAVDGKKPSPLDLILGGHMELVAQKVHNLRTGQPS